MPPADPGSYGGSVSEQESLHAGQPSWRTRPFFVSVHKPRLLPEGGRASPACPVLGCEDDTLRKGACPWLQLGEPF